VRRLLDTDAYASLKRGTKEIENLVREADELIFSLVVLGELLFGFHDGGRFRKNVEELEEFLAHPRVSLLGITKTTADRFGRIAVALKRQGTPIPMNDIWIAAQALENGCEVISEDAHFHRVPGLVVVPAP
jgi:tRNA(fMet)-specific endonuclease VapC